MSADEDYFNSLEKRIGPILAKYSTSSSFLPRDLDGQDGRYEVEIRAGYGTGEDYPLYIEETVGKKGRKKDEERPDIIGQAITVYLPEDFWTKRGEEMAEELRSQFLTAKGSSVKIVVVGPESGFRLRTLSK